MEGEVPLHSMASFEKTSTIKNLYASQRKSKQEGNERSVAAQGGWKAQDRGKAGASFASSLHPYNPSRISPAESFTLVEDSRASSPAARPQLGGRGRATWLPLSLEPQSADTPPYQLFTSCPSQLRGLRCLLVEAEDRGHSASSHCNRAKYWWPMFSMRASVWPQ